MITTKCNQYTARWWFKLREPVNWAISIGVFVLLIYARQFIFPFISFFTIAVIGIVVSVFLCFFILHKRAIGIVCPNLRCGKYIETNTPWKCGNPKCQKENEQVEDFPIVYHCQHCKVEQKAFECPHCQQSVFLSKAKLKTIYATFLKMPEESKPRPVKKDKDVEEMTQLDKGIQLTARKVAKAKLDLELKAVKNDLEPKEMTEEEILEKSAARFKDRFTTGPKIVERWKAENAKLYKDNPVEHKKQDANADQWALNNLGKM
jgi:hypothetical protein